MIFGFPGIVTFLNYGQLFFFFLSFHYPKIYFWPNTSVRDFSLILLFNSI